MKVLVLSAYDAVSHQHWYRTLMSAFPEFDWTLLTLPARYFSWRVRGNSLSWAFSQRELLEQPYDLIVATSMVDLSALRGFVPSLGLIPSLVYFHENQFAYPQSGKEFSSVEPKILSLYTALAADRLVFNSHYNRDTFLVGAQQLLEKLPDQVPAGLIEKLANTSEVIPVPLAGSWFLSATERADEHLGLFWHKRWASGATGAAPIKIVWAARWEFDKGPDRLLAILRLLEFKGVNFNIAVVGQRFRRIPEAFNLIESEFSHRLVCWGYLESGDDYRACLQTADIILSTALHEFQGVSVLEAIAAGCVPVLPNRQVYPELVADVYLYKSYLEDIDKEAVAAVELIEVVVARQLKAPEVSCFSVNVLRGKYAKAFEAILGVPLVASSVIPYGCL